MKEPFSFASCEVKKFLDEMPGGFFIYQADEKEQILYANQALLRIFNCDTFAEFKELTGNSFHGIVHPQDLDEVHKSIQEQISNSQYDLDYVEYRIIQKGGGIRWVEDYGHFVRSEDMGEIFYVFVGDATDKRQRLWNERKEKEQKLQDQIKVYSHELKVIHQEHLRRLEVIEGLSSNYDTILYANLETDRILPYRASKRMASHFPAGRQSISYQTFIAEYVSTWVAMEDRDLFIQATAAGYVRERLMQTPTYYINYRVIDGSTSQYLQLRVADVSNDRQISRIVLGARQVEDEIQHEMEQKQILEDALYHAKIANNAKDTFLSNISHDIRTPLNAIAGFTALAKNHLEDSEKVREYLEKIELSNARLLHLLSDVLEISRIESGMLLVETSECDLNDLISDLHAVILPKANAKQIAFSMDLSQVTHHKVLTDPAKLKQILLCLLSNAVKYTNPQGKVQIRIREKNERSCECALYEFSVEDNGIGICEDFHKIIFEPFERVKNTTLSGIYGTGLGLTIAKNLVQMMGGTIHISSALQKGSTFTVSLNLHVLSAPASFPEDDTDALEETIHGQKILLVEDNEINREIESELLKNLGFLVQEAEDGSVALDLISHASPDEYALVFMDIQMPIMDGYEATRAIRSLKDPALANIPIIALSANAFDEDRQRSMESGMNAHLAKPVDIPQLLGLITAYLHTPSKEADPDAPEGT